ncbi:hypothetical protein A2154_02175 [Candidatus Gottesmanbacteria bacterium RBG_16_43_7]|uniref:Addiction module toxin RelE n=1 Tax=Candidatus Gottesmanbacteria bacterium RBG_16_43_7 TaxID=1798373 RepID=A0A1F5Z9L8_9BACT|nr:MAG: hypothetical protein A2154_02175 [Candidatus Gottesmanbacteria bacterium RBG_16_43_7]
MYKYEFTPGVDKELRKLPLKIQKLIIVKLDYFASSGHPLIYAQHLINYEMGQYRFRIGDYRVIFDLKDETIVVLSVGHRRNIYK